MSLKKFISKSGTEGLPGGPNEVKYSIEGYKMSSNDRYNPYNVIPSGDITMKGVPHPVFGTDNLGNSQMMYPGQDYQFPGSEVFELPMLQEGGDEPQGRGKNVYVKMPDGEVKYLNTDSEEYREMYNSGRLGSVDAEGNFHGKDLPEITVETDRRDWLGEGANALRAIGYSPLAAASGAFQVPQSLMTEGIEALRGNPYSFTDALDFNPMDRPVNQMFQSKQRVPSETLGYENPEGFGQNAANFGLDMIDPSIFTGAGAARNTAKAGAKGLVTNYFGKKGLKAPKSSPSKSILAAKKGLEEIAEDVATELPGSPNNYVKAGYPNPFKLADQVTPRLNPLSFIEDGPDMMSFSPMNILPGYGKKLNTPGNTYRKFGNTMDDVIERQALSPEGGSGLRMGKKQITGEGNWAGDNEPWEKYKGVFTAEFDLNKSDNLGKKYLKNRSGTLMTDKQGNTLSEIPLSEPGMEFHRRLPFSTKYIPVDKQKLIDNKFQLATQLPHVQSLIEKYGIGAIYAGVAGKFVGEDYLDQYLDLPKQAMENIKKVLSDGPIEEKQKGGEIPSDIFLKQQFKESTFNPKAESPAGAKGIAQIMPNVWGDAVKAGIVNKQDDIYDPNVNKKVQEWYMNDLYNSSFINKPGQSDDVRLAKTLAGYNWGRGNLFNYLTEQKKKGVDIYKSTDWLKDLPLETKDYVNKILLNSNEDFNKEYETAVNDYNYQTGGSVNSNTMYNNKKELKMSKPNFKHTDMVTSDNPFEEKKSNFLDFLKSNKEVSDFEEQQMKMEQMMHQQIMNQQMMYQEGGSFGPEDPLFNELMMKGAINVNKQGSPYLRRESFDSLPLTKNGTVSATGNPIKKFDFEFDEEGRPVGIKKGYDRNGSKMKFKQDFKDLDIKSIEGSNMSILTLPSGQPFVIPNTEKDLEDYQTFLDDHGSMRTSYDDKGEILLPSYNSMKRGGMMKKYPDGGPVVGGLNESTQQGQTTTVWDKKTGQPLIVPASSSTQDIIAATETHQKYGTGVGRRKKDDTLGVVEQFSPTNEQEQALVSQYGTSNISVRPSSLAGITPQEAENLQEQQYAGKFTPRGSIAAKYIDDDDYNFSTNTKKVTGKPLGAPQFGYNEKGELDTYGMQVFNDSRKKGSLMADVSKSFINNPYLQKGGSLSKEEEQFAFRNSPHARVLLDEAQKQGYVAPDNGVSQAQPLDSTGQPINIHNVHGITALESTPKIRYKDGSIEGSRFTKGQVAHVEESGLPGIQKSFTKDGKMYFYPSSEEGEKFLKQFNTEFGVPAMAGEKGYMQLYNYQMGGGLNEAPFIPQQFDPSILNPMTQRSDFPSLGNTPLSQGTSIQNQTNPAGISDQELLAREQSNQAMIDADEDPLMTADDAAEMMEDPSIGNRGYYTAKRKSRAGDIGLAGLQGLSKFFNDREADKREKELRSQTTADNVFAPQQAFQSGSRGDHMLNPAGSNFRVDETGQGSQGRFGKVYQEGGENDFNKAYAESERLKNLEKEYVPLGNTELEALAHQFRGSGSGNRTYIRERGNIENKTGKLTEREYNQLQKYMSNSSGGDAFWQSMPNFLGDSGDSAIPHLSRLYDEERGSDIEGWDQYMGTKGYRKGGQMNYQEGGEYTLSEAQIKQILASGGQIEYLD